MLRWTLELDTVLCDSIVAGKAWQEIAAGLHLSRDQVARRASRLGLKRGMSFKDAARRVRSWDRRRTTFHIHTREIKKPVARQPLTRPVGKPRFGPISTNSSIPDIWFGFLNTPGGRV